ncbi:MULTISPECIES: hypothetical protein [unclassified Bradyrhizobium]|uniref:hypothetical protein n=1 Tax=unclassified Bradyrhizobium TaxID=2631580 RepID=UPI0028E597A5|nr:MULTISPECIES: hypothetical protein [unclassified Bradyrhizobium]
MVETDAAGSAKGADSLLDKKLLHGICDAFNMNDLKILVRTTMGKVVFNRLSWDQPKPNIVLDLLDMVEGDGRLLDLLNGIKNWEDQQSNEALQRVVDEHLDRISTPASVKTLNTGINSLRREVEEDAGIRSVVAASRKTLDQVSSRIDALFHYKELHDCLHDIQLRHYREIIDCAKELGRDPQASFGLQQHVIDLAKICSRVREAAELLPEVGADRTHVRGWIEELESAIPKLRKAVRDEDTHDVITAVFPFRSVIVSEQSRVNASLNRYAEELPLRELSEILANAVAAKPAGDASAADLQEAIASLRNIKSQLSSRVAEHDKWQRIEKDFWEAEDNIEKNTPESLDLFKEFWPAIKSRVDEIASTQAEADWAKDAKEYASRVDETIASHVTNFGTLRRNFKLFRDTALLHFFNVDRDLKAQCGDILKIREPLRELSDKV